MRIDKEEQLSLKKLFVGIFVVALLITMTPLENIGQFVAMAEGGSSILNEKEVLKEAEVCQVGTPEEL